MLRTRFALMGLALLLPVSAFAANKSPAKNGKKPQTAKTAEARNVASIDDAAGSEGDLIPRDLREFVFEKTEMGAYVKNLDELDRDLLIMAIWKKSAKKVRDRFPAIPAEKIVEARDLLVRELKK